MGPKLDQQLCFSIYSASLEIAKFYKPYLAPLNLTYPQYLIVLTLLEEDRITAGHLAARLRIDPGALTPILKRMETAGILKRQRLKTDERSVAVNLTAAGQALSVSVSEVAAAFGSHCGLTASAAADLQLIIESLSGRLSKAG